MSPAIITLLVLVVAIIIFVSDRLPMGLVAFMVPMALYFTGVIDAKDIFCFNRKCECYSYRRHVFTRCGIF